MAGTDRATRATSLAEPPRGLLTLIWIGLLLQVVGQIIDLRWHASHEEFEGAADQVSAHWLLWIGTLTTAAGALAATLAGGGSNPGLRATLWASALYGAFSVWHFAEHANGTDPELAHLLLLVTKVGIVAGVIWTTVHWRRRLLRRPAH